MAKTFYMIFYDRDQYEYEIVGITCDDTNFTYKVCEIQKQGRNVNCSTPLTEITTSGKIKEEMKQQGYSHVKGLYDKAVISLQNSAE